MENKPVNRIVSGVQPTSDSLHLGNFIGAVNNWIKLSQSYETFFFIPNLHALTVAVDSELLKARTLKMVAMFIAAGINPEENTIFIQSQIPAHTQLAWILNCEASMGQIQRMTQFKDKTAKVATGKINVGLFTYPILMAADILLYQSNLVPVGEDQRQHLELTKELAQRFNQRHGTTFTIPAPYIVEKTAKIYDLQQPTIKMSKSNIGDQGIIWMLDEPKTITKKIRSAVTDTERIIKFDPVAKPGISNLLTIQAALQSKTMEELEKDYREANYSDLKANVTASLIEVLNPIRENYLDLIREEEYLLDVLSTGTKKASEIAAATLGRVYEKLGILI